MLDPTRSVDFLAWLASASWVAGDSSCQIAYFQGIESVTLMAVPYSFVMVSSRLRMARVTVLHAARSATLASGGRGAGFFGSE